METVDGRRRDVGELRDRKRHESRAPQEQNEDRDNNRQRRPVENLVNMEVRDCSYSASYFRFLDRSSGGRAL